MIKKVLYIGRWKVVFIFFDFEYDFSVIEEALEDIKASNYITRRVKSFVSKDLYNSGFMISNENYLSAMVVVGPTTSSSEFINTLVHEIHHLSVAITENLGISLDSETPAYISGDAAMELAKFICDRGCSCNHKT